MVASGLHSTAAQFAAATQASSWQSVRPLWSSSMPLLQISGIAGVPVDNVTVVVPASSGTTRR